MSDAGLSNVRKYYAYKATKAVAFYRPVMYLYLLSQRLSFTQVTILEALYNLTTLVGEIPTGYVGDRVGRRTSLLIGTTLITVTLVAIGLASTFITLAALWVCWSAGYNFRSGSEDAWLYDTITDEQTPDQFAHVRGRGQSVALIIGVGASIVGGYLAGIDLASACVLNADEADTERVSPSRQFHSPPWARGTGGLSSPAPPGRAPASRAPQ